MIYSGPIPRATLLAPHAHDRGVLPGSRPAVTFNVEKLKAILVIAGGIGYLLFLYRWIVSL